MILKRKERIPAVPGVHPIPLRSVWLLQWDTLPDATFSQEDSFKVEPIPAADERILGGTLCS